MADSATVTTIAEAFKDLDLSVISQTLLQITPVALGVIIPVIAVIKAISFLSGAVQGCQSRSRRDNRPAFFYTTTMKGVPNEKATI